MNRESEYLIDRKDRQIRELMRENTNLRESVFRKDRALLDMEKRLDEADSVTTFLGIAFAVCIIAFIVLAFYALGVSKEAGV